MEEIIFDTPVGKIIGWKDAYLIRATGIPYAKAERYQAPDNFPHFIVPFRAQSWSPAPLQISSPVLEEVLGIDILERTGMQENCQHLSITRPASFSDTKLPVMVWIYGGSYTSGAGDAVVYDPSLIVREQQVIVVSINYRLGLLGFLGGYEDHPANLGLLDIICALKWIKQNIQAFGGDSACITLFGQSAGGDAIAHLIIADGIEGLFHNVIIQSAPLGIRKNKAKMHQKMIQMAKTIPDNADQNTLLCKQSEISEDMQKWGLKGGMPFGIQYGYFPMPTEVAADRLWKERSKHFNILIGFTEEETSLFMPFVRIAQLIEKVPFFGKNLHKQIVRITTDIIYRKPAIQFAKDIANKDRNTFLYRISWHAPNKFGATHTVDIPLLLGDQNTWKNAELLEGVTWEELHHAGKQIRSIWAQFAKTGQLKEEMKIPETIQYQRIYSSK